LFPAACKTWQLRLQGNKADLRLKRREEPKMNSSKTQLVRFTFARMLAIALLALIAVSSAFAQVPTVAPPPGINPGTDVGDQGMFLPKGLIRVPIVNAAGAPVLNAAGLPTFDYFVSDTASGFCRLDQTTNPANGGTSGALNLSTCFLNATGAPQDYQVEFGVVFVADMSLGGVWRFTFIPDATGHMIINPATEVQIFGPSSLIGSTPVGAHPRVEVAKMGPDGKLYITFPGNGDIWRIRNPLSPTFTPAGNKLERVGTSDNGRRIDAFAWVGNDLWMDQAGFLNRLQNAPSCNYTASCAALLEFGLIQSNTGMASDATFSTNVNGNHLYFSSGNTIADYDTTTQQTMTIVTNSGNLVSGPGGATTLVATSLILGLNLDQATGDFLYVDDPLIEAPGPGIAVPNQRTGRAWSLTAAGLFEPCGPSQTCSLTSEVGTTAPVFAAQEQVAARRAILVLAGVTHPRGLIFLGRHYWVSDEISGFCRIDVNPVTNAASLTNCFHPHAGYIPGQADADAPAPISNTRNLYVPDASGTPGLARFKFDPAGDNGNGTISQTGLLSTGPNAVETVAVPKAVPGFTGTIENAVYLGFSNNGAISKITSASTAPSALSPVANTENGVGVISMAFYGSDLYMAEEGTPVLQNGNVNSVKRGSFNTLLPKASPSMSKGTAVSVAFPVVRGQFLGLVVQNPLAIAIGPEFERPLCLGPPGVATGNILSFIPGDLTTAPSMYVGASAIPTSTLPGSPQGGNLTQDSEVDQWSFTCKTQSNWADEASINPLIALNLPIATVTAIAVDGNVGNASMMIADDPTAQVPDPRGGGPTDPSGIPLTSISATPGQGHIYIIP
jgi:hypothetical protein